MTESLRLTGSRKLTSSDSNVASDWVLPAVSTTFSSPCENNANNMSSGNAAYGNYYNWYAATAGSGTCTMSSGNAAASICPRGWRLPTGGSTGELNALYGQYDTTAKMQTVGGPAFVLSGGQFGSSTINQNNYGYYWSSTALSSSGAYYLGLDNSNVFPADDVSKYRGFTVRCLAR